MNSLYVTLFAYTNRLAVPPDDSLPVWNHGITLRVKVSSLNWPEFTVQLFVRLGWTGMETGTRVCCEKNEWLFYRNSIGGI